ncbi:MAG TPA: helicase, partial [Campylobacterales bacterium]|nr:helicase [Campylobacterales bacterium]
MAKKKKKQTIKINNKIKELMNGEPFDEGIKYLDENILIELTMILDLKVPMLTKKEMVKALRRVWSEGNVSLRLNILNYLEQLGVKSSKEINKHDKVSYILTILENFEHTKEEEDDILSAFIDSNFSKITKDKLKNKLNYIRQAKKIKKWEDILDITINNLSQIEFYHSYTFDMSQESFNKSLLTQTKPIDTQLLDIEDDKEIKTTLEKYKEEAIQKKEEEIEIFLTMMINKGHCYLKPHEINQLVRQMPPEDDLYGIDIPLDILKRIIKSIDEEYRVVVECETIYITKDKLYPIYNKELPYTVLVTYTRNFIYRLIWKEEELPIASDLSLVKSENKRDFEITIMELEDELEDLSQGLELDHNIIEKYILRFIEPQITSSHSLKIKEKIKKRIHYHFLEYLRPLKEKKRKEELLANTIRDFKSLYPIARLLNREIIFHVGATNSGKTYQALQHLQLADTGYYLAPLRLLALEGYETLKAKEVNISLITGEEEIIDEDSKHISSTIEMMNSSIEVDV